MKTKLLICALATAVLYLALYAFHWAAPPIDTGVHGMIASRLRLASLPGALALKRELTSMTTAAATFTAITSLLFVSYLTALRIARGSKNGTLRPLIVVCVVILATMNLIFYPWLSSDIFQYGFYGKAMRFHGANPFTATVRSTGEDVYDRILYWKDTTTPYGPLAILIYAAIYSPSGNVISNALSAKVIALLFFYATVSVVATHLKRHRPARLDYALMMIGLNPLILLEAVANAHNDIIVSFLIALSAILALKERFPYSLIALIAASLVKCTCLMLLPLYMTYAILRDASPREKIRELALGLAGSALLLVICFLPFWEGWDTFNWVGSHIGLSARSFHWMLSRLCEYCGISVATLNPIFIGALGLAVIFLSRGCGTPQGLVYRSAQLILFYIIFCCFFNHPWYLLWAAPLVALADAKEIDTIFNTCCICAMLGFYPLLYLTRNELPPTVWWMSLISVVPPAVLYVWFFLPRRRAIA